MSIYDSARYATWEFEDETSGSDPGGKWIGGCEYYERKFRVRVPKKMLARAKASGDFDLVTYWLEQHAETPGVWLN